MEATKKEIIEYPPNFHLDDKNDIYKETAIKEMKEELSDSDHGNEVKLITGQERAVLDVSNELLLKDCPVKEDFEKISLKEEVSEEFFHREHDFREISLKEEFSEEFLHTETSSLPDIDGSCAKSVNSLPNTPSKKRLIVNVEDAVAYLHTLSDDHDDKSTGIDVALEPPDDGLDSDVDDPAEELVDIGQENIKLLGENVLAKPPHIELNNRNTRGEPSSSWSSPIIFGKTFKDMQGRESEIVMQPPNKKLKSKKPTYTWNTSNLEKIYSSPVSKPVRHNPVILNKWSNEGLLPIDVFKVFWNNELMDLIKSETNLYHQQKFGKDLAVSVEELYKVLGILLLSGYNMVPNRRLFWSRQADTRNLAVIQCGMSVNRFEEIIRSLHFVNNSKQPVGDKFFKVRPLFEHFNKVFLEVCHPLPMSWAIDEAMEPYYGRHGLKQFIRGKPVRFGYKIWCLCSHEGFLVKCKLYEGKDTGRETDMSVGESVVKTLALELVPKGSHGYIDNFFTTLPLLELFREEDINLTGTIRRDRIRGVPLSDMKKVERGEAEVVIDQKKSIVVCHWQDNSNVTVATNRKDAISLSMGKCKRWSKKSSEVVVLPQPMIIQQYNQGMGGVDLFDQFRAKYRVTFRKRVWYYPLIRFVLNASIVNGWILYRKIHNQITELDFLREVVQVLLKPADVPGKFVPLKTPDAIRYDRIDHNIVMGETQRRCGVCKKNVKPKCTKCDVALHVQCWVQFHSKPK